MLFSCEKPFTVLLKIVLKVNHESLLLCFFISSIRKAKLTP